MINKLVDIFLKLIREEVIFQFDDIFDRPVVSFNLSLRLGMIRSTSNVGKASFFQELFELLRDKAFNGHN